MHRFWLRLLLVLPLASIVSVVVGFAAGWLATMMSCQGEVLACNIGEAIGAYAVLIWALLGPIVFGVTLLIARNRVALLGATLVLLTPLAIFFVITTYERWLYDQADLYVDGRTFLVTIAPPALAVIAQWLVLRAGLNLSTASRETACGLRNS